MTFQDLFKKSALELFPAQIDAFDLVLTLAVALAKKHGCQAAILKAKSPSCGNGAIYDGTFSRRLISGWGVAAEQLRELGLTIVDEDSWQMLLTGSP